MEYSNVLVDRQEQIGIITLNRPQAMNTFNVPFARELNAALWEMENDPDIRVVVIDANGKHFSTGISLDEFKGKTPKEYREFRLIMQDLSAIRPALTGMLERAESRATRLLEAQPWHDGAVDLIGLRKYYEIETGILSYGQKKLVALASALMPHPKIVVLDEPVAGVNPSRIREIETALSQLNQAGETFLIVEHNVEFITNLCHQVIVLDQGKELAEGTAREIHSDPRVLEAYLGMTPEMAAAEMRGAA